MTETPAPPSRTQFPDEERLASLWPASDEREVEWPEARHTNDSRYSERESPFVAQVRRLQRRLWVERGLWCAVLLGVTGAWLYPVLFPSVWAISVDGKPVVELRDKELAQSTLLRVKREAGVGPEAAFAQTVAVVQGRPGQAELADASTAAKRLSEAVTLRAPRGVVYVDDLAVVALPDEAAAKEVLERLKQELSMGSGVKEIDAVPSFKERVEVRLEDAPQESWADPDTALALLKGEDAEEGDRTHTIRRGESAWTIAADGKISVERLAELNPGINLKRLRVGQQLVVKDAEPPLLTVVAEGTVTRTQPLPFAIELRHSPKMFAGKRIIKQSGIPGQQSVTYRIRTENGRVVGEEAVSRKVLRGGRPQIVVLGDKPRG